MNKQVCVWAAVIAMVGGVARAQVAPQGIHHPTVGPGAGLSSPVSPTGSYGASVPLDLPMPRGGLPVPLSVVYSGSKRAGVAGTGWEVPLWYVQRSTSAMRRKPLVTTDGAPRAAERLYMSLGGGPQLMVPDDGVHLPFMGSEYGQLLKNGTGWRYRSLDGTSYVFEPWQQLGGSGAEFWLLTKIQAAGSTEEVRLEYAVACDHEVNLSKISFTRNGDGDPLYEIALHHGPLDLEYPCKGFDQVQDEYVRFERSQLLREITVAARNNLDTGSEARRIRSYAFEYGTDPDTDKPRLTGVTMLGARETNEEPLPVAQYEYGVLSHAPAQPGGARELRFGEAVEVPRPSSLGDLGDELATSAVEVEEVDGHDFLPPAPGVDPTYRGRLETTRARHTMRDFTGDGVTDLLYLRNGHWVLNPGKLATSGVSFATAETWWPADDAAGPAEIHVQTTFRVHEHHNRYWARAAGVLTETWVSIVDWNGDGRLDIVDVKGGQTLDYWRVWLNEPAWNREISWRPVQVSVAPVRAELAARGIRRDELDDKFPTLDWINWLSLERTRSWRRFESQTCTPYECHHEAGIPGAPFCDDGGDGCDLVATHAEASAIDSITDWGLRDVNSDGFPDLALAGMPARYCEVTAENVEGTAPACGGRPQEEGDYYCLSTRQEWLWSRDGCEVGAEAGDGKVFFNRTGPFLGLGISPFGPPFAWGLGRHGIEHWTDSDNGDPLERGLHNYQPAGTNLTWRANGLADTAGEGWLRSVQSLNQDVSAPSHAPVGFFTDQPGQCGDAGTDTNPYTSRQVSGHIDMDGDGLVDRSLDDSIRINGGLRNGPPLIPTGGVAPTALSSARGTCGSVAKTTAGYTDMDGDGKPEALRIVDGKLMMSRLIPGHGENLHAAGRLIAITNGYGARTEITYGNAKEDFITKHLPYPEIVVRRTQTKVVDGSGPDLVPTHYGYGTAKHEYDPLTGRWGFAGYERVVTVTGTMTEQGTLIDGVLSAVRYAPAATPGASFEAHAVAHRPISSSRNDGLFPLANFKHPDTMGGAPFAAAAMTSAVKPLLAPGQPSLECADLDPTTGQPVGYARCAAAALVYTAETEAWEGDEGPPSLRNHLTRVKVLEVDGFGRPTRVHDEGDVRSTLDDVCTTTSYATPAVGGAFPSRPDTVVLTNCGYSDDGGSTPGTPSILSVLRLRYDGLPAGQVSAGRLTSRIVDRYDENGYRDTFVLDTRTYDAFGELDTVTRTRSLGSPATFTTTLARDEFAASVTSISSAASDVPHTMVRTAALSTWPWLPAVTTDANGIVARTEFDRFGRVVREVARGSDGTETTLRVTSYDDSAGGRRIVHETFPILVAPGAEAGATERSRAEVLLDALGRARFVQSALGDDYGNGSMISGLTEFDAWGRAAFVAAPFEWPAAAYEPDVDPGAHYGTTTVFDQRGRVLRSVEAEGRNELAVQTSVAGNIFVTELQHGYQDGLAYQRVDGRDENDPASPRALHYDVAWTNARGQVVERARFDPAQTRIDLVRQRWDRLGRNVAIDRYVDPQTAQVPVSWSSSYDSLGRRLSMTEPGAATRFTEYDEQGNPLETWWQDGVMREISRSRYDGFGRPTEHQLITETSGVEAVESVDRLHYDERSTSKDQPQGAGMLGRLSWSETNDVGAVYHAYDPFGRAVSSSYLYSGHGQLVRQSAEYTAAGRLTSLTLRTNVTHDLIAYDYDSAGRVREVRDGDSNVAYWTADAQPDGFYPSISLGNGVVESHERAAGGARLPLSWSVAAAGGVWSHEYRERDAHGRITLETHERPGETDLRSYAFDSLGRLTGTVQVANGFPRVEAYTYDPLGNVTSRTATTSSGSRSYTLDATDPDRLCRSAPGTTSGPCNFTYDGIGNVLTDVSHGSLAREFKYDPAGRIVRIDRGGHSATLTYGPAGRAYTKVVGVVDRDYWSFGGLIEEQHRGGEVQVERHIPGPLGIIATKRSDGYRNTIVYSHGDGRANRVFTDDNGDVVQAPTFSTFGRVTDNNVSDPMTFTDDLWNGGDDIPELGVVLLGPRAYDPDLGRFLQRDPIAITSRSTTANPYAFAFSDPVNFSDPTGLSPLLDIYRSVTGGSSSEHSSGTGGGGWLANSVMNAAVSVLPTLADVAGSASGATNPIHIAFNPAHTSTVVANAFSSARTACGLRCTARDAGSAAVGMVAGQSNRIVGGVRLVGGYAMVQAGAGLSLIPTGVTQTVGIGMIAVGTDQAAAGAYSLVTNKHTNSVLFTAASAVVGDEAAVHVEAGVLGGLGGAWAAIRRPPVGVGVAAANEAYEASSVLRISQRNLQKFFGKHGADFGLTGNWNRSRAAEASRAINAHINSPGVSPIAGTYRGGPAIHYLDPVTRLNVVADPAGNFVTGYRLGLDQLRDILTKGNLF